MMQPCLIYLHTISLVALSQVSAASTMPHVNALQEGLAKDDDFRRARGVQADVADAGEQEQDLRQIQARGRSNPSKKAKVTTIDEGHGKHWSNIFDEDVGFRMSVLDAAAALHFRNADVVHPR